MKKIILLISVLFLLCGPASQAAALDFNFDITFTADNIVDFWAVSFDDGTTQDLTSWSDGNWGDWQTASTYTNVSAIDSDLYSLVWEIRNAENPSDRNPGGFLASITDTNGGIFDPIEFTQGSFNTSASWLVSLDMTNWYAATEYGANNSSTIWYENNGNSPVAGISNDAQWIWWENNFSDSPDTVYVRVDLGQPVPEPGTIMLLGIGLLGIVGIRKKLIK